MIRHRIRKLLVFYDAIIYFVIAFIVFVLHKTNITHISSVGRLIMALLGFGIIIVMRLIFKVYSQIWRYGGMGPFIKLMISDCVSLVIFYLANILLFKNYLIGISNISMLVLFQLVGCMMMRMVYYYLYRFGSKADSFGDFLKKIILIFGGVDVHKEMIDEEREKRAIKIALVGAGRIGTDLALELQNNRNANYIPVCFIDKDENKIGRYINNIPIIAEESVTKDVLNKYGVSEIAITIPDASSETRNAQVKKYSMLGYKVKIYDYPEMQSASQSKRQLREFDIEDLLFRKGVNIIDNKLRDFYEGKSVLVTGGGGSIGSEICRQLAKCKCRKIIIFDIAENGPYLVRQEILLSDPDTDLAIEVGSITDMERLRLVFEEYKPEIVINAAAHKHVPLMEKNCCEAVLNNVFGTWNVSTCAEEYGVKHFLMVSTDKAVNPTSVMGATKRVCEMIIQSRANMEGNTVVYSATRFGNVLGSAGSVVPLFKKQIASGGPVTITDKRIVRYFMTISEACQLVMKTASIAKKGELFVLDMGKQVKILDLAENMIYLSGLTPYKDIDIIETGLRPGEKLYEETLIESEKSKIEKTEEDKIYIEFDKAMSEEELAKVLDHLKEAALSGDDDRTREALHDVIPEYIRTQNI